MTVRPSHYENLPDSSESCASQPTFAIEGHLQSQHRVASVYNQQPAFRVFRGVVLRERGSFEVPQHSEQNPIRHQRAPSSQVIHDPNVLNSELGTLPLSPEKQNAGSWYDALSDWWWWELGSVLLSFACFIAIVITLWAVQEQPLSSWHSVISPNALLSTLATISKASLMLSVAACISQLKWLYYESGPHPIQDIQIFDDASRGPLGALDLIMRLRLSPEDAFSHRSGGAGWAFWASVLTILALVSDPFAQQLLSFPLRAVPNSADPLGALISAAQVYDTRIAGHYRNVQYLNVDMAMQGAVQNGLYTLNSPVKFICTTGNCVWPTIYTLGICSSCTNVTHQVNTTCIEDRDPSRTHIGSCNFTLPSGLVLSGEYGSNAVGDYGPLLNATAKSGSLVDGTGTGYNITDSLVLTGITRFAESWRRYTHPEAFECRLSWCAKRYFQVKVNKGEIETSNIRTWPLTLPAAAIFEDGEDGILSAQFEVSDNTDFDGLNRTFILNAKEHNLLADWLAHKFFTTTEGDAVGRVLYRRSDISQTFANIATSMTNSIREGPNSTKVLGISHREETYIHVTWPWLILPGVIVLMGIALLTATITLSRGDRQALWKNTTLAPLFTNLRGWEHENLRVGRWSEMMNQTKGMRGRLRRDGQGGLDLVREY